MHNILLSLVMPGIRSTAQHRRKSQILRLRVSLIHSSEGALPTSEPVDNDEAKDNGINGRDVVHVYFFSAFVSVSTKEWNLVVHGFCPFHLFYFNGPLCKGEKRERTH